MTTQSPWLEIAPLTPGASSPTGPLVCARDKSLTHRAIMFAAMAKGESLVHKPLLGEDCRSTMACFEKLGVSIEAVDSSFIRIQSPGQAYWKTPESSLDCGNSGTTARLLCGLLSSCSGLKFELIGDESLSKRPMARVVEPLRKLGANISGPDNANFLPLHIVGSRLHSDIGGSKISIEKASAQVKSALLLACASTAIEIEIDLPLGSRDHTEKILKKFAVPIQVSKSQTKETISCQGPWAISPFELTVPVDPSSAAFFTVYALIREAGFQLTLSEVLDNPTRLGFLKVLQRMSGNLRKNKLDQAHFIEEICEIQIEADQNLIATDIEEDEVASLIDEIPILAVAAVFSEGISHFRGIGELRVKESDRLKKTAELLIHAGAHVIEAQEELTIHGGLKSVKAFEFDPEGDHRLAMAAAILAKKAEGLCKIKEAHCAAVSYPDFFEVLEKI